MDLIAPLFRHGFFGADTSMVFAFLIGLGFGFALEVAGFGNARKLTAQFYLFDMAVYKVMFTAVVTSMFLVQLAVALGLMNFGQVFVPATFVWPQIVGGLLLGVGFVVGGYCPGTSVVSVASGKLDGMVYVLGFFAGLAVFPNVFDWLADFYASGSLGVVTLFDWVPIPPLLLAALWVAVAVASFFGVVRIERWAARRWLQERP